MTILLVTAAAVVMLVVFVVYRHSKAEVVRLRRYRFHADRFFERIQPIVADAETPLEVVEFVQFFNRQLIDPGAARFAYMAVERMIEEKNGDRGSKTPDGPIYDFFERRVELREPFSVAMSGALLAITYSDRYWGPRARRLIALVGRHTEFAPAVAKDIRDRADKNHGGGMNGAVAAAA